MAYLSVIIPVYNSENTLDKCLRAIRKSDFQNYEFVVVDDGSTDDTINVAEKYTDKVIKLRKSGRSTARKVGFGRVHGKILVNIDSDVVIFPDTLTKIANYFAKHPEISALTGLLSKRHPNKNFASQYKNLYMNYHFLKLPKEITFLYGSIFAFRREIIREIRLDREDERWGEDTDMGQQLVEKGYKIHILKNLEVVHYKKYTILSLLRNDFKVPFEWAGIFLRHRGWKQLGKGGTGFAHASREQIASLMLMPFILVFPQLVVAWFLLNFDFFLFLYKERGTGFVAKSMAFTLADHFIMFAGVVLGSIQSITKPQSYLWGFV